MVDGGMEVGGIIEEGYEIEGLLGRGGFGVVYKAKQRTTGQLVAIKTLLPQATSRRHEQLIGRFMRETRLCAQLYHPNIVQLIDAGKTAEGQLYTVFAYVPGKSLSQILADEGALDPEEARHLMLQVLDALACAHACGIVHRDLKPGNIMVIATGARRNALVLDFGIGTIVTGMSATEHERLTGTSDVIGTPGYAAPEQLNRLESSAATDLFAWGLVFIECLTGRPVYSGFTLQQILFKQLGAEPVSIPVALQHHPLGRLLEEVTRKDPAARPQDTAALLKRLEACSLRGVPRAVIAGDVPVPFLPSSVSTMTMMGKMPGGAGERIATSERRQVTALCCSLKLRPAREAPSPPEESARALDVEEQNRSLLELFDACARVVQEHRGLLAATFGEQALVFFGYPQADEQDGKRAARAALALRSAMATEHERLRQGGLELAARIGLHSGLVVTRSSPDVLDASLTIGLTPAIAARIAERSPPGGIVASGAVQRILRSAFDFEAEGVLGDTPEPLKLFRLQGEHTGGVGAAPSAAPAPLVGREPELKLLAQRWEQARQGTGQCGLISGEPGIGKSRLALALHERIGADPHLFLSLRASPDAQDSPLFPVLGVIERLLDREGDDASAGKLARLESLLSRHGLDPSTNVPLLAALLSIPLGDRYQAPNLPPEVQKRRALEAIRLLLFAMAEARPLFMLVEDLHWADPTTLDLVRQMIERAPSAPVYIVLTARPELAQASLPAAGVLQISLSRLGSDEVEALVAELLEGRDLPAEVLDQIIKRADGVPLFIEELAQMLVESGVLVLRGDSYELARRLRDSDIPSSLRDLLTSRLDRLGEAKETAQLAATLGREFGLALLSATSERGPEDLQADLERLLAAGLIQSKRKRDDKGYVFKHSLIRDAAYESISLAGRREVHARVAKALEERFASIVEARPDLLAHHHAAAEQKREAIRYAQSAGRMHLRRAAYAEARRQVEQALPWVRGLDRADEKTIAELGLNSILMPAMMASFGYADPRLEPLAARTLALCEALGDQASVFPTLYGLAIYHHMQANRAQALALSERMVTLAEASSDVTSRVVAHDILSTCYSMAGRFSDAEAAAGRALAHYDPVKHRQLIATYGMDPRVHAHIWLSTAQFMAGHFDRALTSLGEAAAWARELNRPDMIAHSLFFLAGALYRLDDFKRVLEMADEGMKLAERYDLPFARAWNALVVAATSRDVATLKAIIAAQRARGELGGIEWVISLLAEAEAAHGRYDAALGHLDDALRICVERDSRVEESSIHRLQGEVRLARDPGDVARAEACFLSALEVARAQGARYHELRATTAFARLRRAQGRVGEARDMLSRVYEGFTEGLRMPLLEGARALLEELGA